MERQLNVMLPNDVFTLAKVKATKENITLKQLIERLVREYINEVDKNETPESILHQRDWWIL